MARIRTIKPERPQDPAFGACKREARYCYLMLTTQADDAGRLRGNSRMLASILYPYDDDAKRLIDGWLDDLELHELIIRYLAADAQPYIAILDWQQQQKIDKPSPSRIPPPPEPSRNLASNRELSYAETREASPADQGREGKGSRTKEGDSAEPSPGSAPAATAVVAIPLLGGTEHPVYQEKIAELELAYPAVNVLQQLREMRQWCLATPHKRKTARGVNAFIVRWLAGEQDRGGKPSPGDVARTTIPGTSAPDPEQERLKRQRAEAVPPPASTRADITRILSEAKAAGAMQ